MLRVVELIWTKSPYPVISRGWSYSDEDSEMIFDLPIPRLLAQGMTQISFSREGLGLIETFNFTISSNREWPSNEVDQRVLDRLATKVKATGSARLEITAQDFPGEEPLEVDGALCRLKSVSITFRGYNWVIGSQPFERRPQGYGILADLKTSLPNLTGSMTISDTLIAYWTRKGAASDEIEPNHAWEHILDPVRGREDDQVGQLSTALVQAAEVEVDAVMSRFGPVKQKMRHEEIRKSMLMTRLKKIAVDRALLC
jgi:hypothetical protein